MSGRLTGGLNEGLKKFCVNTEEERDLEDQLGQSLDAQEPIFMLVKNGEMLYLLNARRRLEKGENKKACK
jgi:hypothetical protein